MIIHVVEKGDTLYGIGMRYGVTVNELIAVNGASVSPTLVIGQAVIVPTSSQKSGDILVNGYAYPFIESDALTGALASLSLITPFSYGVNPDATLVPLDDSELITLAENGGVRPLLLITTLTAEGTFSSENAAAILSDISLSEALADNIISKLQTRDYYGVDIDFEYIPPQYADQYVQFIETLRSKAAPLGFKVFIALAPKTSAAQSGLLYEAHVYDRLGAASDYALIMTYEWGYTYGPPMAVAPLDKVEEVLRYAITEIPPEKVLMGIPNYAYDWTLPYVKGNKAQSITNNRAIETARRYGAEIQFDTTAMTPYFNYFDESGNRHVVWFEDARSISAKLELMRSLDLAGISVWTVMSRFEPLYTVINSMFNVIKL